MTKEQIETVEALINAAGRAIDSDHVDTASLLTAAALIDAAEEIMRVKPLEASHE